MKPKTLQNAMPYGQTAASLVPEVQMSDREKIILQYTPLIKYIAHRLAMRLPAHIIADDLIGAGVIGLIDAINKFDPGRNVEFKTYAEFRIRGAMIDELRALDWVPRSVRQKATKVEQAVLHLERKKGRSVEDEEVASELGLSMEEYYQWMNEIKGISFLDIEFLRPRGRDLSDEDLLNLLTDGKENDPFQLLNLKELKDLLARAIDQLSPQEKLVLSLYYFEDLTLKEIGEVLELTESRICQIHTKGILRLRAKLKRHFRETP
ncbi:MAG: FliA/WhiG family RNA polymerase sigma factor [Thermodesulfobacteriota bacterium]